MNDFKGINGKVSFIEDPYQAAEGCHALAILTEWDAYRDLDYEEIYRSMSKPAFIFDGRNIFDHNRLFAIGFDLYSLD